MENKTDEQYAKDLVDKLRTIDKDQWLEIAHTLNGWEFPLQLYDVMPHWYLTDRSMKRANNLINLVMSEVKREFGEKESLRYHNVFKGRMSDLEFEYWFDNIRPHDSADLVDKYYDRERNIGRLEWWKDDVWKQIEPLLSVTQDSN